MSRLQHSIFLVALIFISSFSFGQVSDSTQNTSSFSGSVGLTNNGFSIVPSFSLNSPAFLFSGAFQKKRFSFEPDFRIAVDAKNGGLLWWFRYRLVQKKNFGLRTGVHPALTIIKRQVTENGKTSEISELLRFAAFEVVPSYQINKHFGLSAMYLHGNALQSHGPQVTRVLFLNTSITGIGLSDNLNLFAFPSLYYLNTDGYTGSYFTGTVGVGHKKLPLSLQSTINQTLKSNVPGNKNFMWNITVNYNFQRIVARK